MDDEDTDGTNVDDEATVRPAGRRRRRRWFLRWLSRSLVLAGVVFALVYWVAGVNVLDIGGAQQVNYTEECTAEGCSSEEVAEIWVTFQEECFGEGCWMEEVAENAGTGLAQHESGDWYYINDAAVSGLLAYFARLGHYEVRNFEAMEGRSDTFGDNLIRMILENGVNASLTCRADHGGIYRCGP